MFLGLALGGCLRTCESAPSSTVTTASGRGHVRAVAEQTRSTEFVSVP